MACASSSRASSTTAQRRSSSRVAGGIKTRAIGGIILDVLNATDSPGAIAYEWRRKEEPVLWLADAVCGAVREHLLQTPSATYFDQLVEARVVSEPIYISERAAEPPRALSP